MVIQKRENDLVLATFGRGFYILDDYTPLRERTIYTDEKAHIFPIKDALTYVPRSRGGSYGSMPYKAKNRDFGATFTYYLKEAPKKRQALRRKKEKEAIKNKVPISIPTPKELYDEKNEENPYLVFTILDEESNEIRKLTKKAAKGVHRITWDLRYLWSRPIKPLKEFKPTEKPRRGILALPGAYKVKMELVSNGTIEELVSEQSFIVKRLHNTTLPAKNPEALADFQKKLKELARVAWGTNALHSELTQKVNSLRKAALRTSNVSNDVKNELSKIHQTLLEIEWKLRGEQPKASYEEIQPAPMAILPRLNRIIYVHNQSTSGVTQKERGGYQLLKDSLKPIIQELSRLSDEVIPKIEKTLNQQRAPWTSGRVLQFEE